MLQWVWPSSSLIISSVDNEDVLSSDRDGHFYVTLVTRVFIHVGTVVLDPYTSVEWAGGGGGEEGGGGEKT